MAKAAKSKQKIEFLDQFTLPHHSNAEASLIGGLLLDPDSQAYDKIADIVSDRDFYHPENKQVFTAIQLLKEKTKVTDLLTVSDYLDATEDEFEEESSINYLSEVIAKTSGSSNIIQHAKIIREKALLRELIQISSDIAQSASNPAGRSPSELVDLAETNIFKIAERGSRNVGYSEMSDLVKIANEEIDKRYQAGGDIIGVSSGFKKLDDMTAGLQNGELIIIAGRPSMGKTALALNIAEHAALMDDNPVAIFSMEMSASALAQRMISSLGRVNAHSIKTGKLTERDFSKISSAMDLMKNAPIYIDDTPSITPIELRSKARRIQREKGLKLIVVDYLQLMRVPGNNENRAIEISEISRNLKALARELNIPVIALSQLNRSVEQRIDKHPQLSDLRDSGAIEQDADVIAFIYREWVYLSREQKDELGAAQAEELEGTAVINIAKQRNGAVGEFTLTFLGKFTKFENWDPQRWVS